MSLMSHMSEITQNEKGYYASGVFKVDYKAAGYKDLLEVARRRSKDENFYYLELRKVSADNRWLQFVYFMPTHAEDTESKWGPIKNIYKKELQTLYDAWFYAWDYMESDEINPDRILVSKAIVL